MLAHDPAQALSTNAAAITYSGTAATAILWGMNANEIAVLISTLASVCGVILQFYLALRRITTLETRQDVHEVTCAIVTKKVAAIENTAKVLVEHIATEMNRQDIASSAVEVRTTRGEADQLATHKVITSVAGAQRVQAAKSADNSDRIAELEHDKPV